MSKQLALMSGFEHIESKPKPRSPYQMWKSDNNYRKSDNKDKRCANCKFIIIKQEQNKYYKCLALGISGSSATDIRLNNCCDLFIPKNATCALCKHLDCIEGGDLICGLDGDILDHEGISCSSFEEYKEECENANSINID